MTRDGLPTGEDAFTRDDVADPHSASEENYDKIPNPGGVHKPNGPDIGPNSYAHDGKVRTRPKNGGSGPQ